MKKQVFISLIAMILSICLATSCSMFGTIVPDVSGQPSSQAIKNIEECGFTVKCSEAFSFTVPKDVVISQNIKPGKRLKKNGIVSLVVSAGIEQISVPDLQENTLEQAKKKLEDLDFRVNVLYEYSDTVKKGTVLSQSVLSGKKIDKKSEIKIGVSKGPEFLEVPKLIGKTLEETKNILSAAGFKIDIKNDIIFSNTIDEGSILSQDAEPGKMIKEGSTISVAVSAGVSNTIGNTAANLYLEGNVSAQGNWIYFLTDHGEIYKYSIKTKEKTRLYSHPSVGWGLRQINVVGEWVYFYASNEGIFKVRIDGTGAQKIIDNQGLFMYMCVADGYIYYNSDYSEDSGYRLYRMKIDGSNREKTADEHCNYINITGDYIYYNSEYSDTTKAGFYRMKRDGTERTLLASAFYNSLYIYGNDAYISNGQMVLCKSNISGITQLTSLNIKGIHRINALGDWIYFVDGSDIYRVKTDGTEKTKVSAMTAYGYYIAGDWIVVEGGRFEITIMKPDGTGRLIIHKN